MINRTKPARSRTRAPRGQVARRPPIRAQTVPRPLWPDIPGSAARVVVYEGIAPAGPCSGQSHIVQFSEPNFNTRLLNDHMGTVRALFGHTLFRYFDHALDRASQSKGAG